MTYTDQQKRAWYREFIDPQKLAGSDAEIDAIDEERAAAERFLAQWPEGPQADRSRDEAQS